MTHLIQYDPRDPPRANNCTNDPFNHAPGCDGTCGSEEMTEVQVMLWNEMEFCRRAGIVLQGIPSSMAGKGIPGFPVEIFELQLHLQALLKYLAEQDLIDMDRMNELYAEAKLEKLVHARKNFERQKMVADKPLFGPDGKRIN